VNLQQVNPKPAFTIKCIECGEVGSSDYSVWFADTQGEPFKAYYCKDCADKLRGQHG
jgi:uncharacterized protein YlaI